MYAAAAASRRSLFAEPLSKSQRLNYEGDVKTIQNQRNGFSISFDAKTGMPKSVSMLQTKPSLQKMFCKVCHDAGKPESIYTGHFVRASPSPDAPVVCPTLLAQPCRYCGVAGHTVKYCPNLSTAVPSQSYTAAKDVSSLRIQQQQQQQQKARDDFDRAINRFSALAIADSDASSIASCETDVCSTHSDMVVDEFDEIKNLSLQTLTAMLSSILQMNPTSDNKLVIALENAITDKRKSNKARPPFCSPLPVSSNKIETQPQSQAKTVGRMKTDWADCDDEEIDFTADLPNFPPLPVPSLKRSYSDITRET